MNVEEQAFYLARSLRLASIDRQMDELWRMFLLKPSRLNSNDFLWMRNIEATAKLILEMDHEQSASDVSTSTSSISPTPGTDTYASQVLDELHTMQSSGKP